jgi:hypothetical protein
VSLLSTDCVRFQSIEIAEARFIGSEITTMNQVFPSSQPFPFRKAKRHSSCRRGTMQP